MACSQADFDVFAVYLHQFSADYSSLSPIISNYEQDSFSKFLNRGALKLFLLRKLGDLGDGRAEQILVEVVEDSF